MTKLLTEQELQRECLTRISLAEFGTTPSNLSSVQLASIAAQSVDLYQFIQSQKQAHADMVIGKNNQEMEKDFHGRRYDVRVRNELRAEQGERNK